VNKQVITLRITFSMDTNCQCFWHSKHRYTIFTSVFCCWL